MGSRESWGGSVLTGQVRDDEVELSGMERKELIQMLDLLDIGGGHSLMRRKRSLRNRGELMASCPDALWDEGELQSDACWLAH